MKKVLFLAFINYLLSFSELLASDTHLEKKDINHDNIVILSFIDLFEEDSIFIKNENNDVSSQNSSISQNILSFTEFKKENNDSDESSLISNTSLEAVSILSLEDEKKLPQIERGITLYEPHTSSSKERSLAVLETTSDDK